MTAYFIDSNVVMYAVGTKHRYKASCQQILKRVAEESLVGVTSTEVIQEILYRYFMIRKRKEGIEIARDFSAVISDVLPITPQDMELVLSLLKQHLSLPPRDALHVAVMKNNGLSQIITADNHFKVVKGIKRIDPLKIS